MILSFPRMHRGYTTHTHVTSRNSTVEVVPSCPRMEGCYTTHARLNNATITEACFLRGVCRVLIRDANSKGAGRYWGHGGTHPSLGRGSTEWVAIGNSSEENGANYNNALKGKTLFSALCGIYTATLHELKALLKASTLGGQSNTPKATGQQTTQEDGFQEVRRRKRQANDETAGTSKKAAMPTNTSPALNNPAKGVVTRNFFRPPQDSGYGHRSSVTDATSNEGQFLVKQLAPPNNPNVYH
jgi:hypothetical protein